jgi:outer membrane protein assembly factor BamB
VVPLRTGALAAHSLRTGALMWTTNLGAEQPLAADVERVYVASGEAVHALHAASGDVAWRVPVPGKATAPPLAHGGWVIATAGGEVLAMRAADGAVIWRRQVGAVEFRPAIDGELLIVPLVAGRLLALDVQNGEPRWDADLGSAPAEPLAIGGRVYVGTQDKHFHRRHVTNGRKDPTLFVGAVPRGRPVADDHHVYFTAMDNVLRAIDRGHGAIEWKHGLPYRPAAGPVLIGEYVVVPGDVNVLPAFHARTGAPAGKLSFPALLAALPVFSQEAPGVLTVVAISGGHEDRWTVSMLETALVPAIPSPQPLTELPGEVVPPPPLPVAPKG